MSGRQTQAIVGPPSAIEIREFLDSDTFAEARLLHLFRTAPCDLRALFKIAATGIGASGHGFYIEKFKLEAMRHHNAVWCTIYDGDTSVFGAHFHIEPSNGATTLVMRKRLRKETGAAAQ